MLDRMVLKHFCFDNHLIKYNLILFINFGNIEVFQIFNIFLSLSIHQNLFIINYHSLHFPHMNFQFED